MTIRIAAPSLVVLIGPPASGKSTWAAATFRPDHIVSSDALRALVGEGEHDQRAGTDAFEVLDDVIDRRLKRGLLTVVDTLGTDRARRERWLTTATARGIPSVAVVFDTPASECRARNRARGETVPAAVLSTMLKAWPEARDAIAGFGSVVAPTEVEVVPEALLGAAAAAARQASDPVRLDFGLQVSRFPWAPEETRERLRSVAEAAEGAGFTSLWVMDHLLQIPQVGREWEDMLESWTTLGYLAGVTSTIQLGTLVTGVTYRNVAHLAKIAATLDVLSGGRAWCGIGAAWFEREHRVYGWEFPPLRERYALLEDALELLPLMWGKGAPAFEGRLVSVPEAMCYPRPIQERIPIMVGGSGERTTLRLVAKHADACNLFGDTATVEHKVGVLHRHCVDAGRDPAAVLVSHLATSLVGEDRAEVDALVAALKPKRATPESYAAAVSAGTVADHVGRFRGLHDAGVRLAIVNLPDLDQTDPVERFGEVISAFR